MTDEKKADKYGITRRGFLGATAAAGVAGAGLASGLLSGATPAAAEKNAETRAS